MRLTLGRYQRIQEQCCNDVTKNEKHLIAYYRAKLMDLRDRKLLNRVDLPGREFIGAIIDGKVKYASPLTSIRVEQVLNSINLTITDFPDIMDKASIRACNKQVSM